MTYDSLPKGSVVLHLEFSIADAVYHRGLFPVLGAAVAAWWSRPALPADLPAYLRADVGLPPAQDRAHWLEVGARRDTPAPLRRPGL